MRNGNSCCNDGDWLMRGWHPSQAHEAHMVAAAVAAAAAVVDSNLLWRASGE
jgi:hypothetical protein